MKTIRIQILAVVVASILTSALHTLAIEGLQISVQSTNAILFWPSATNETYLVQYRPTLDTNSSWMTLTDDYPAAMGTDMTFFVHSNSVQYPLVQGGGTNDGGGSPPLPEDMSGGTSDSTATTTTQPSVPMVQPVSGSGDAVPMAILPPGFDLSGYLIYYPSTGEWMSGNGYTVPDNSASSTQTSDIQPMDSGGDTNQYTGFYRVVRDGVHLWGLTNGMILSNEVITPIEFAVSFTDQVVGVSFYDGNTNPIIGAAAQPVGSNAWFLEWNTTMSLNGTYNVYAELDFASNDPVVSAPVTVTVNNLISFPNELAQSFGNWMWIYAQTIPNAAYQLDLYDENTNYLGSFLDYADNNGVISFIWDLTDYNGNPTSSSTYYGFYTVDTSSLSGGSPATLIKNVNAGSPSFQSLSLPHKALSGISGAGGPSPQGSSPSANANYFWSKENPWSLNGPWVVAYGLFSGNSTWDANDKDMIIGSPGNNEGVLQVLDQNDSGLNVSPGNNWSTVFTVDSPASAQQLLGYLQGSLNGSNNKYRNFYFFGHGNNHEFGSYTGAGGDLTQDQIAYALGNVPLSYDYAIVLPFGGYGYPVIRIPTPTTVQTAALHPYRFVFIDGCDSAAGTMSEAFAIPAATLSTNNFIAASRESRVFIGYTGVKYNWDQFGYLPYSEMMYNFLNAWTTGSLNAQQCVNAAKQDTWPTGRTYANMDGSAVVYGTADLISLSPW